jgi:hypothetical protein
MHRLKKVLRFLGWTVVGIFLLLVVLIGYVRMVAVADPPQPENPEALTYTVTSDSGLYKIKNNWFRHSDSGLYELYVEGEPFERGVAIGKLSRELVQYQEVVFNGQIHRLIPSPFYLTMLKYFVGWFNRDIDDFVADEYKQEILGVSESASHEFDDIASPYQRILNYHGAHDIGHALQNMSLVGCTSFATWGAQSADSSLIIGRNFDFYVGDDFARDKIVAFYKPSKGFRFMMITFGGMTGVLSGMNDQGLTITLNAAKSEIPSSAATPVSLVAREILQYASTIDEAYAIAEKRKMFVAESLLVGSAKDGRAAVIEKTPDAQELYTGDTSKHYLICTNHFQSAGLGNTPLNEDHKRTSASVYRYQRVDELLKRNSPNTVTKTAALLRNQEGLGDISIGLGNEKSVNQLIAHHAVIFQPEKLRVWVSTAPWQLGKFVCYDLNKVFAGLSGNQEIYESDLTIPADSFQYTPAYRDAVRFNAYRFPFNPKDDMQPDSLVTWNPKSYHAYMLAGDYYLDSDDYAKAQAMFERGLTCEVATEQERAHMQKGLEKCKQALK